MNQEIDMKNNRQPDKQKLDLAPASYEPPRIEKILTPEDLEREAQYAGISQGPVS